MDILRNNNGIIILQCADWANPTPPNPQSL
jgi:hypothetical protein